MVWLAVTRPLMPRRIVSAAITSTNRECSSSVSSQWMSTSRPNSSASAKENLTDSTPSSRVSSKCGMPPIASTPSSPALAHQLAAAVEPDDALLRKRDQLQVDLPARLLAQLDQRPQRDEIGVAHVDVRPHVLHAIRQLPAQHFADPLLHVVHRQVFDPLAPHRDALEQRARPIGPRLPDGQHRVEVDVRLDQRRRDQPTGDVEDVRSLELGRNKDTIADADVAQSRRHRARSRCGSEIEHAPNLRHRPAVRTLEVARPPRSEQIGGNQFGQRERSARRPLPQRLQDYNRLVRVHRDAVAGEHGGRAIRTTSPSSPPTCPADASTRRRRARRGRKPRAPG